MNGTGTKTDPYIIQTAEDLYMMEEVGGSGVCCRLGADIELNDTAYAEHFSLIPVNCSTFDGNGHKIRNIYNSEIGGRVSAFKVMVGGTIDISGLMLENAVLQGNIINLFTAASGITAEVKLYDCAFILKVGHYCSSVVTGENCILHGARLTISSELSVIALSGIYNKNYTLFNGGTIKRTQILLDLLTHDAGTPSVYEGSLMRGVSGNDFWVSGSVTCDASGTDHVYHMADSFCTLSNCYQAVAINNISSVYWNCDFISTCFYDNDLMAGAVYDSRSDKSRLFYGLTTAQCKDPEYLTSIGFVCGGENDGV